MNYQQFVGVVEEKVRQAMPDGTSVYVHKTMKNNGTSRVGLTVTEEDINISPTIYLEEYFEKFQKKESLESIVQHILSVYRDVRVEHSWETEQLKDYESMKEKIVYKLIHAEKNKELLENVPHIPYLDLAVVFYALLEIHLSGTATLLITNDILKLWGVQTVQIYRDAVWNTPRLLAPEFQTMRDVIADILGETNREEGDDFLYVLTNRLRSFGAACMLYEHVLEDIGNQLGENFYVIPSSVHEVLIVPESKSPNRSDLEEMIEEINDTQVAEEEILSYRAYYFNRKENRFIF